MSICDYCKQSVFVRSLRGILECSSCGAPAPEGASEVIQCDLSNVQVIVLKCQDSLSDSAYARISHEMKLAFPGKRIILLEDGTDIQFIGNQYATN